MFKKMETYECKKCGWILATLMDGANASCQRCGHNEMKKAIKSPSWRVLKCSCGHKDVYAKAVSGVKCPSCSGSMS